MTIDPLLLPRTLGYKKGYCKHLLSAAHTFISYGSIK